MFTNYQLWILLNVTSEYTLEMRQSAAFLQSLVNILMITCYQLVIPFWNNPLGRGTQLFATGFFGNFVHFVDREIVNEAGRCINMLLARAVIWAEAAIGAGRSAINLWTVVGCCRSSFHD
jgi:hypothetical protein